VVPKFEICLKYFLDKIFQKQRGSTSTKVDKLYFLIHISNVAFNSIIGVPYAAKFEPYTLTETTVNLSWKVNASYNAPVINYKLEFQEIPHGQWITVNVPAKANIGTKVKNGYDVVEFQQSYILKGLSKGANYKVKSFRIFEKVITE
jgi:hypothetical protein